jgi:hypothetical protein
MVPVDKLTEAFADLRRHGCSINDEVWTETDTRSKFIDTVFRDCLGWHESDIHRELTKGDDRLDYRLSTSVAALVVEAKRTTIELPTVKQKGLRRVKINKLLVASPSLKGPIEQVAGYCHQWSAPLAVLTNGVTYIIFLGSRVDNIPWADGDAIILPDLFSPDIDFPEFHSLLSRDAIANSRTLSFLMGDRPLEEPESVLDTYEKPNLPLPNNPIGKHLEPLLKQVFADVTKEDSREVLEFCFVPPTDAAPKDPDFAALQIDKPPWYLQNPSNVNSANTYRKFQDNVKEYLTRKDWAPQTLLVVGGVGVGKTFFLRRHFTLDDKEDETRRDTVAFYIDFIKPELDPTRVPEMIWTRTREQIDALDGQVVPGEEETKYDFSTSEALGQIFRSDVRKFERMAENLKKSNTPVYDAQLVSLLQQLTMDDRKFVSGVCHLLRDRYHRHVCIILDNADVLDAAYQKAVYLFSRTLEAELRCLVIVSLREEWYYHFGRRQGGPMSAYNDTVYHVPAAPVRDVLTKRLDYAIELVASQLGSTQFSLPNGVVVQAEQLARYLKIIQGAFQKDELISVFHESMSNGNIRTGLDIFLDFIRSGHTKATDYLETLVKKNDYVLRFHQVFKPVAHAALHYYHSDYSRVPNLVYPVIPAESQWGLGYFTRAYLLNWCIGRAKSKSPVGVGFVERASIQKFLALTGLDEENRDSLLQETIQKGMLEPDVRLTDQPDEPWTHVKITAKGFSVIRRLVGTFAYWESIMLDTPINDPVVLGRIKGAYLEGHRPSLFHRKQYVKEFLNFLTAAESFEQLRIKAAGAGSQCPPLMPVVNGLMQFEFDRIDAEIRGSPAA